MRKHHLLSLSLMSAAFLVVGGYAVYKVGSKDEVLETIFRDTWQLLVSETERIEASGAPLPEQLRRFARIYLGSWLATPELIGVLVREIARSPALTPPCRT